jgi:hypothetical protein
MNNTSYNKFKAESKTKETQSSKLKAKKIDRNETLLHIE